MLKLSELLTFGLTLVDLVREKIRYSVNMDDYGQVCDRFGRFHFYRNDSRKLDELRNKHNLLPSIFSNKGQGEKNYKSYKVEDILKTGVGNCGELCDVTMQLVREVNFFTHQQEVHCSRLHFTGADHGFLLLHQGQTIAPRAYTVCSLEELSANINNAIIVDPWIYQVTPLKDYQYHLQAATEYNVERYYRGNIKFTESFVLNNDSKYTNSNSSSTPASGSKLQELVNKFNSAYVDNNKKISEMDKTALTVKSFSSVKAELQAMADREKQAVLTILRGYLIYKSKNS